MAAMYRCGTRLIFRQSCLLSNSYVEISKCNVGHLQLIVGRCFSDSLKHKERLNVDWNKIFDEKTKADKNFKDEKTKAVENLKDVDINTKVIEEELSTNSLEVNVDIKKVEEREQEVEVKEIQTSSLAQLSHSRTIRALNCIESGEEVVHFLSKVLQLRADVTFVGPVLVRCLKRLEALNEKQLIEKVDSLVISFFEKDYNLAKVTSNDFRELLAIFVKSSKEDSQATFDLLHEACWRFRKGQLSFVLSILLDVKPHCTTSKRKELMEVGMQRLVSDLGKLKSPSMLLSAMYLLMDNVKYQKHVEEDVGIMLPLMDSVHTAKVLFLLAKYKSKNVALIQRTKSHLLSRPLALDFTKLNKLFYACETLRIYDQNLLQEMSFFAVNGLTSDSTIPASDVLLVFNSCSRLGWHDKRLIDSLMDVIQNSKLKQTDLAYLILSIGHLNLVKYCEYSGQLAEGLRLLRTERPSLWLDIVHSLACMKSAVPNDVRDVLSEAFYQPLFDSVKDKSQHIHDSLKRKLLSLYGYLKVDLDESTSEIDDVAVLWRNQLQERAGKSPIRMGIGVGEALTAFAPLGTHANTNIVTPFGSSVDFEIFVDNTSKAVLLDQAADKQRIWIKLLQFNDFVRGSEDPVYTGSTAMAVRHLDSEKNAKVIYISYMDWNMLGKKIDKIVMLESKIKNAVATQE